MSTAEQSDDNRPKKDVQEDSSREAPDTSARDTETYTPSTLSSIKEMEEKSRSGATQFTPTISLVGGDTAGDARKTDSALGAGGAPGTKDIGTRDGRADTGSAKVPGDIRTSSYKGEDDDAGGLPAIPGPFNEQKARDTIEVLEKGSASEKQAAQRDLEQMGPDVLPQLEQLKNTTESLDTYTRAKQAMGAIKSFMPGEAEKSRFDQSYSQEKATALINQLGSQNPLERARAQDQLMAMGPKAIADLNTTGARSEDAETRATSGRLARDIARTAEKEKFAPYTNIAKDVQELSALAGITFQPDASRPNRGVTRSIDEPKAAPNAEQRAKFENLIVAGDKLQDDKRLTSLVLETALKQPEKLATLTTATHASSMRETYARSLSASQDPKDKEKATALLKEHLEKQPDAAKDWILTDTAARVGSINDKGFKDAFQKAGGDVQSLEFKSSKYKNGGKVENFSEEKANQAISVLEKGSPSERDRAAERLANMGPEALPQLQKLKDTTQVYDAYAKAKSAIQDIKAWTGQPNESPFTSKYQPATADKLIKDLGSQSMLGREKAHDKLVSMGPGALSHLEKTHATAGNAQIKNGTERVIQAINNRVQLETPPRP